MALTRNTHIDSLIAQDHLQTGLSNVAKQQTALNAQLAQIAFDNIRARMRQLAIKKLPLYPEEWACAAPSTEPQRTMLRLFKPSPQEYLSAAEQPAAV